MGEDALGTKVIVGMSGGVDSSVAAYLLKERGYEVAGVTMRIWQEEPANSGSQAEGFGAEAAVAAARVARELGIPHHVVDYSREFYDNVVIYFMREYLEGRTPNPCIICNRYVKWQSMLDMREKLGAEYIATGHYARIEQLLNGRYALRMSAASGKDQTYALYGLSQKQMARTLFPLGDHTKEDIRAIAASIGLKEADKPDSQEICFIPDHDYAGFIRRNSGSVLPTEGNFVTVDGRVLGRHRGIIHYTVGQRKGLDLSLGRPVFVTEVRPETNEVVVGEDRDVYTDRLMAGRLNFMTLGEITTDMRVRAKIRYGHKGAMCTLSRVDENTVECVFDEPVRAVTPGQAVVFYDGEYVVGGGIIL